MINDLKKEQTPLEYTISGLNLLDAQVRILVQTSMKNETLRTLSMIRKKIKDSEGTEIAKLLIHNVFLEKIELEGNLLGPDTAVQFGELIKINRTMKLIDLENNDLTKGGTRKDGIKAICEGLKHNKNLLSLNLNNTHLDSECSAELKNALAENYTLI